MANIGSVFLGDRQRIRHLSSSTTHSTSTPPSSPPPAGGGSFNTSGGMAAYSGRSSTSPLAHSSFEDIDAVDSDDPRNNNNITRAGFPSTSSSKGAPGVGEVGTTLAVDLGDLPPLARRAPIDPQLALELRVRWLEAIVLGLKQDPTPLGAAAAARKGKGREVATASAKNVDTLMKMAENVQSQLEAAVEGNEGLQKFMEQYDQHAQFLTPSFALSGVIQDEAPSYSDLTPEEIDAFLTEMEPDLRSADSDLREIGDLVKKGVTSAGKLSDYEQLTPRIDALSAANVVDIELAASLERRIASLMQKHATSVDTLSELFVAWDDAITGAEDSISQVEREKEERKRLGLE